MKTSTSCCTVTEIGNSRSGPFPFFKLPDVIRRRVFELLCGPFYNNEGYITVSLMKSDWCDINQPGWVSCSTLGGLCRLEPLFLDYILMEQLKRDDNCLTHSCDFKAESC